MNTVEQDIKTKIDQKTKPLGALGQLERIAFQVARIQQSLSPKLHLPTLLVFAADHGLARQGVSAYPPEITAQMVLNFVRGGAAINIFTRQHGIALQVIDAGVAHHFEPNVPIVHAKIAFGTADMLHAPAMSIEQCRQAQEVGVRLVRQCQEKGTNVIGFGEMGIGNTASAALLMSQYLHLPIEECVGRGTGLDAAGLQHKIEVLRQVLQYHAEPLARANAEEILARLGGFELAMMCGAMAEAARQQMLILVDGFLATVALLAATKLGAAVRDYCLFSHLSDEAGHIRLLQYFDAEPILRLSMRLGEGTGAALAYPLVQSAVAFLNDMASFADLGEQ